MTFIWSKGLDKQESIPVGSVPTACQAYVFWLPPLDVSTGEGWLGPQVNKFEQVSSDDHQMSVAGRDPQIGCLGWGEGSPSLMSGGRGYLPCDLSTDVCDVA